MASLCNQCKTIFERPLRSGLQVFRDWHTHHTTHDSFKQAVAAGCYMCKALASEIRVHGESILDLEASAETSYCVVDLSPLHRYTVVLHWQERDPDSRARQREFSIRKLEVVESALSPVNRDRPVSTRPYLDTARKWIKECQDHHSTCRSLYSWRTKTGHYVPKRLVAIGDGGAQMWRLVTRTPSDDAACEYATLSHRWSDDPTVKLSVANLEHFTTTPQPVSDLPATFQDAITVALELGIRYIWIDCLCIIQDSDEEQDWKEQGMEMCNIYTNAVVNISATGVPNNTHSFLQAYEGRSVVPLPPTIQHRWSNRNRSTSQEAEEADRWCIVDPYFWWSEVTNTVLLSRGWVFQERYLAPRVLHFGANQLLWECTTLDACEAYPRGLPDCVKSGGHTDLKRLQLNDTVISTKPPPPSTDPEDSASAFAQRLPEASLQVWCDLVQAYTRTSLTMRKDKLIAFSGVVELVRKLYHETAENPRMSHDQYAAGIFERHLLLMLEWYTKRATGVPKTRPREYRAPTWSWASLDGRVFYDFLPHIIADPSGLPWPPLWATTLRSPRYPHTIPASGFDQQQGASWVPLVSDVVLGTATHAQTMAQAGDVSDRWSITLRGHLSSLKHVVRSAGQTQRPLPGNQRPQPLIVTEDIRGEIFPKAAKSGRDPISSSGFHKRLCLPLRCLELVGEDSHFKYWVTGLVLRPHKELESVYSRCGFFCLLSKEGVQRFGVRISEASPFRAEFTEGMELSTIEIV